MSLWRDLQGETFIQPFECKAYRVVESQHYISTRKLTDSEAEKDRLDELLEDSKPAAPKSNSKGALDYLLFTKFHYPPLRHGSRFGRYTAQGIFYASIEIETAMAEIAYRKFIDAAASDAALAPSDIGFTHFKVHIRATQAVRLTEQPFKTHAALISDPCSYAQSQKLGEEMRASNIEAFDFYSARRAKGMNVGLFSVEAFARNRPLEHGYWQAYIAKDAVEFRGISSKTIGFRIDDFMKDGQLALVV